MPLAIVMAGGIWACEGTNGAQRGTKCSEQAGRQEPD
jgi:hypothetical protein